MALVNNFENAGPGIVTSYNVDSRNYRVGDDIAFIDYREEIITEEREWVGLTYDAAIAVVQQNAQPGDNKATHSWSMSESNRVVKSYAVRRVYERKESKTIAESEVPLMLGVVFSAASQNVNQFPYDLTISSNNSNDVLRYRVDAMDRYGNYIAGQYVETTSNSIVVSLNTTTYKLGLDGDHKQIRITAHTRRYTNQGVFDGPESDRVFIQKVPTIPSISVDNVGSLEKIRTNNIPSIPYNVTATINSADPSFVINYNVLYQSVNNAGDVVDTISDFDFGVTSPKTFTLDDRITTDYAYAYYVVIQTRIYIDTTWYDGPILAYYYYYKP